MHAKNLRIVGAELCFARVRIMGSPKFFFFFQLMNDNESLYNTPPTWSIYITKLFLDWLMTEGGMKHFETLSQQKSEMIYDIIDSSQNFYR